MTHSDLPPIDELLAGHALGDLDEAEQASLRQQLAADPSLQRRLDELATTLQLLPLGLPAQAQPPARLRQRLLAPAEQPPTRHRSPAPSWSRLVMAALAGGLIVTGLQVQQLRHQLAQQSPPAATAPSLRVNRTMVLEGDTPGGPISGQVVVQADQGYNLLRLKGLPPAPPQHVYRLWAEVDGRQVGCVQVVPDNDGVVAMPIPSEPSSHASRLSISLEPLRPGGDQ
ncbi:anti-sigma factor domain-containing protein, partial [Aphanothece stagnina]